MFQARARHWRSAETHFRKYTLMIKIPIFMDQTVGAGSKKRRTNLESLARLSC